MYIPIIYKFLNILTLNGYQLTFCEKCVIGSCHMNTLYLKIYKYKYHYIFKI